MKRFNRPRYWLLALALLMAISSTWVGTRTNDPRCISLANCKKVKKGMTPEEVEACFGIHGEMSGDYVHTVCCINSPPSRWKQEEVHVIVVFDNGRVTEAKVLVETKTLAEWLKGWIGL